MSYEFVTIGVNQLPATGTDYPFVDPPESVRRILLDLYLGYKDPTLSWIQPFKMEWMYGFGEDSDISLPGSPTATHAFDVLILDAAGQTVFDSTVTGVSFYQSLWGSNRIILKWKKDNAWLHIVAIKPSIVGDKAPVGFNPQATLDARTTRRWLERVTGIKVGTQVFTDVVEFAEGFNIEMTTQNVTAPRRKGVHLTVNARPGKGLGRQKEQCEPEFSRDYVAFINRIPPDKSGNFIIQSDGCFRLRPPVAVVSESPRKVSPHYPPLSSASAASSLVIDGDCVVCCPCEYYVNTYEGIRTIRQRWKDIADSLVFTRDRYHEAIDRWNNERTCRLNQPARLQLTAEGFCYLNIAGIWCNMTKTCVGPVELRFSVGRFRDGELIYPDSVVVGQAMVSHRLGSQKYVMGGSWPIFVAIQDQVDPQSSFWARFRIKLNSCMEGDTVQVQLTVHAPDPLPAPDGTIVTLPNLGPGAPLGSLWPIRALDVQSTVLIT